MTDSMKFGPEWLRNMSNDMSVGAGGGGSAGGGGLGPANSSGPLGPRFQQAEYRYGREEMLSLYEKNLKLPEILPSFKKLFVDKVQLPLALSPSTDDELVMSTQQRQWVMRSPVSLMPTRGTGRGGSVDRGRGRSRGVYHVPSLSYPRPTAMYDEEIRGIGRGERGWPERNGGNEIGAAGVGGSGDWNGSPSSSPRKEYSSHGRGSNMENWRRNRIEEDVGDGWRGAAGSAAGSGSSYRWSRSTSWRDDESTIATGVGSMPQITRSFSSSASVSNSSTATGAGGNDRGGGLTSSASSGGIYKPTAQINSHDARAGNGGGGGGPQSSSNVGGGGGKPNTIWDQEDLLPEWAMENATDGGGSFDATGAFVGPNDENDMSGGGGGSGAADGSSNSITKSVHQRRRSSDGSGGSSNSGPKSSKDDKLESSTERKPSDSTVDSTSRKNSNNTQLSAGVEPPLNLQQALKESPPTPPSQMQPAPVSTASQQHQIVQQTPNIQQHTSKNPFSDLSDRMQEVADDMVEKLIMDDELSITMKTQQSGGVGGIVPNIPVPLLKPASSASTDVPTNLQRATHQVHNHPMMVPQQSQQPPSNELWFYRDPQNKVQGPFSGTEMAEWYRSDYFDENLFVRRVCDLRFATLGELVKMCGNSMPFLSSHLIPPLQILPVVPMNNQPSAGVPGSQSINTPKPPPPPIGNPILGAGDMLTSVNMNLQYLQKDYLLRQQNMILSKLSSSEPFTLLSPERQQQILSQQMAQVSLPEHIVNLQAFANFLYGGVNPSTYAMQQMMPGGSNSGGGPLKPDLGPVKIPGAMHNLQFMGGHSDYGPAPSPLHALIQGNSGGQSPMVPQQPIPQTAQQNVDEPIKNLLHQMAKGMQQQQQQSGAPLLPQHMGNKWPPNTIQPSQSQQQQGWSTGSPMAPVGMWDFDPLVAAVHSGIKPEMKTEQQILEEQRLQQQQQQQQQQHHQHLHHQHNEALKLAAESGPAIHQPQPSIPPIQQPRLELQQHQQPAATSQQQPRPNKKEERSKPGQDETTTTSGKLNKPDESKKPSGKGGKAADKRETVTKPKQTEEERKKELVEERRKQKEEKKRQQLEDERKRLQAQEDEKRRQMLEEKKRQEEIDHHRRAKMLENATPKPGGKQSHETGGSRISSSSIAPWSNTGLPGITTPPASLAEIQKAERERRAEEQRLEQLMELQRKSQQMETLVKADIALKWNAQPIKSVNVKSLAEIQAEEHKQQLAYEHSAALAAAENRRLKDENERRFKEEEALRRFKEETAMLSISQSQSSFFGGGAGPNANGGSGTSNSNSATGGGGPGFGSIWSTRPSSFTAWNGKTAWSVAANNAQGFWEQPTKTAPSGAGAKQNGGGGGTAATGANRLLVKSQTISNIQTSVKNNHQVASKQNAAAKSTGQKAAAAAAASNQSKGPNSAIGGQQQYHNNGASDVGKKDDARNEFTSWCIKALSSMKSTVDVPTFIGFLQDIESPYEVKDYIRMYLGETKECSEFGKQFLERRSKYKNQQRALNAHIDDMCSPAPAINPSSNDFQEVKGKGKKLKKSKMTKLDARILGFSVTAAQDRINVGDRDYGDAS